MLKLAVIGDPISHSLSPEIHIDILSRLGISAEYTAVHVRPSELGLWIERALREEFDGFNVTMPHKLEIMNFISNIDDEARMYGAVNTVLIKDRRLYGYNTDGRGFRMSLIRRGIRLGGKKVVIAGSGGAALTIAKSAEAGGSQGVIILGRKELPDIAPLAPHTDIFINATPLGMHGCDEWGDLSFVNAFPKHCAVFDSIYNPIKTKLLQTAEYRGLTVINGLGMLVCQALLADEVFIGKS